MQLVGCKSLILPFGCINDWIQTFLQVLSKLMQKDMQVDDMSKT